LNSSTLPAFVLSCKHTSNVVTTKLHIDIFPDASVPVHVTVVVPTGNVDPDGGVHTNGFAPSGQLSVTTGSGYVTTTPVPPITGVTATMFAGQTITGACVSLTVTLNEQLA
jgi:hypothetical protein